MERIFTDQMGTRLDIPLPQRIISLVPSQTELLHALGLGDRVAGITRFCIHPDEWYRSKTRIGGTKKADHEKIRSIGPDLIIGNKEENNREDIEQLRRHYNVWMSDIFTLKDALQMIVMLGAVTGTAEKANHIKLDIEYQFGQLEPAAHLAGKRVAYFIWKDPWMVAARETFINDMLERCGLQNAFGTSRYPQVTDEEIVQARPDLVFLSSEPYPFAAKHLDHFHHLLPGIPVHIVDGEMFSWYGSRLQLAAPYFRSLLGSMR